MTGQNWKFVFVCVLYYTRIVKSMFSCNNLKKELFNPRFYYMYKKLEKRFFTYLSVLAKSNSRQLCGAQVCPRSVPVGSLSARRLEKCLAEKTLSIICIVSHQCLALHLEMGKLTNRTWANELLINRKSLSRKRFSRHLAFEKDTWEGTKQILSLFDRKRLISGPIFAIEQSLAI